MNKFRMPNRDEEKLAARLLIALAVFVAGVPLILFVLLAFKSGFGLNRTTFVSVLAAMAIVGAFIHWLRSGAVVTPREHDRDKQLMELKNKTFMERFRFLAKRDLPYRLIGFGFGILGILLAIAYVEYVEPYLNQIAK